MVLHLIPDGRLAEGPLHNVIQPRPGADAVGAGAVGNIIVNAHGEGIGLLEDHADLLAQHRHILLRGVDLMAVVGKRPGDLHIRNQVVHAVDGAQEGGFAAAGGADESGDLLFGKRQ